MAERPQTRRSATGPSPKPALFQRYQSSPSAGSDDKRTASSHAVELETKIRPILNSSSPDPSAGLPHIASKPQLVSAGTMNTTVPASIGMKKTRTGRISKAAKGLRVHNCEDCGKTYTRAEHLRRHQQNHKPGEFPCDFPDCRRSFYREDLLSRHKIRHSDPFDEEHPSQGLSTLPSPALHPVQITQPFADSIPVTTFEPFSNHVVTSAELATSVPFVLQPSPPPGIYAQNIVNTTEMSPPALLPMSMAPNEAQTGFTMNAGWQSAPPSQSPVAFQSPVVATVVDHCLRRKFESGRRASTALYAGQASHSMSQSPVSAVTPAIFPPRQAPISSRSLPNYPTDSYLAAPIQVRNDSINGFGSTDGLVVGGQHLLPAASNASSLHMISAEERDMHEQVDLALLVTFSDDSEEGFYMKAYWQLIHPLYPIVHRSSFTSRLANPLLKTAMLALGAHALRTQASTENSRLMHEQCIKILKKRTSQKWHTFRVCDLQAIVLVEIFALFRSRRPTLQISPWFMDAYRHLASDQEALQSDEGAQACTASGVPLSDTVRATFRTKQHLLLTCYIVSQTWATLFGRRRAIQSPVVGTQLPFPRKLASSWNESLPGSDDGQTSIQPEKIWQVVASVLNEANPRRGNMDSFQSLVMMSAIIDPDRDPHALSADKSKHINFALVRQAMEQTARCRMTWHILMLCKNTPVRALLAVAGESWILGEKLGSPEEYAALQLKTRNWAKGYPGSGEDYNTGETQVAIERAFHHAKQALDIHRNEPQTGLPFQEWAIYLAGLVVWARGYMGSTQARQAKAMLNMREPDIQAEVRDGRFDDHELEQSMLYLAKSNGSSLPWATTRCVLLWIRGQIERVNVPLSCAITNSAQDVLMKLVLQGDADGWFG